jgi:hypothetical protein
MAEKPEVFTQSYFHGTKADLRVGDHLVPGQASNYGEKKLSHIYFSCNLNVAIWGAELALGEGAGRIYVVEPTGPIENDPNLTDKKFAGNPTNSFRTRDPLRIVAEVKDWKRHSAEEIRAARENIEKASKEGKAIID